VLSYNKKKVTEMYGMFFLCALRDNQALLGRYDPTSKEF